MRNAGTETEIYWEVDEEATQKALAEGIERMPYLIELVGVTCHPALAVARGVWRTIRTGTRCHAGWAGIGQGSRVSVQVLARTGWCLSTAVARDGQGKTGVRAQQLQS